tara:strand:+ start:181 stop:348 length:168 start_codon:yes stop_codon:yes gene_type:complete
MLVEDPKLAAIFGRLGKNIFIVSAEILARSISVKIWGGLVRSRKRILLYLIIFIG